MVLVVVGVQLLINLYRGRKEVVAQLKPVAEPMRRPVVPYGVFLAPTHGWVGFGSDGTSRWHRRFFGRGHWRDQGRGTARVGSKVERDDPLLALRVDGQRLLWWHRLPAR